MYYRQLLSVSSLIIFISLGFIIFPLYANTTSTPIIEIPPFPPAPSIPNISPIIPAPVSDGGGGGGGGGGGSAPSLNQAAVVTALPTPVIKTPAPCPEEYICIPRNQKNQAAAAIVATNPTPSTLSTLTKNLKIKDITPEVKTLQKYLNTHGYVITDSGPGSPGQETMKFGLSTHFAVIKFQKDHNLPPTGLVGKMTRKVMVK